MDSIWGICYGSGKLEGISIEKTSGHGKGPAMLLDRLLLATGAGRALATGAGRALAIGAGRALAVGAGEALAAAAGSSAALVDKPVAGPYCVAPSGRPWQLCRTLLLCFS